MCLAIPGQVVEFVDDETGSPGSTSQACSATSTSACSTTTAAARSRRLGADPRRLRALEGRRGGGARRRSELLQGMGEAFEQELEELKASVIE